MASAQAMPIVAMLALAVAGCLGGPAGPAEADGTPPLGEGEAPGESLALPRWSIGDAWTYDLDGASTTYVVAAETASDWSMETDSAERAFADAREDISRLGPQRKSDLAGSQGGDRVEFFRWPLEAGRAWTTRWDGQDVSIQVLDVAGGVASLQATLVGNGSLVYRYTYDEAARWFGELRRYEPDGTEAVRLVLAKATQGWSGTLVRWALTELVADAGSDPPAVAGPQEVPAGTTDVWLDYHFTCTGTGGYTVAFEPVNPGLAAQQGYHASEACVQVDFTGVAVDSPHAGTWSLALTAGGQGVEYSYTFLLRTRQDVKFPG